MATLEKPRPLVILSTRVAECVDHYSAGRLIYLRAEYWLHTAAEAEKCGRWFLNAAAWQRAASREKGE